MGHKREPPAWSHPAGVHVAAGVLFILLGLALLMGNLFLRSLPVAWAGMLLLAAGAVLVALRVLVGDPRRA